MDLGEVAARTLARPILEEEVAPASIRLPEAALMVAAAIGRDQAIRHPEAEVLRQRATVAGAQLQKAIDRVPAALIAAAKEAHPASFPAQAPSPSELVMRSAPGVATTVAPSAPSAPPSSQALSTQPLRFPLLQDDQPDLQTGDQGEVEVSTVKARQDGKGNSSVA